MKKTMMSNIEFTELKERINREILRRGTYKWFDPLTNPSVGTNLESPLSIPNEGQRVLVDDKTYTINNPSTGSLEETDNIKYPSQGENPGGQNPDRKTSVPNTSAAQINVKELKNYLIGLAKIHDINLYYGREEQVYTAFRDPNGIEEVLIGAEESILNKPRADSDLLPSKIDPNNGWKNKQHDTYPNNDYVITYPQDKYGEYYMPSGERDGEELRKYEGLGPNNFYDDYGAQPGDINFHPYNRYISKVSNRDWLNQDNDRKVKTTRVRPGGLSSKRFGPNPRNPQAGNEYPSRPVYGGVVTNCQNFCTGLCYTTCDNQCSESCTTTCFNRCGEQCTNTCGNVCTGCSNMCYSSCKTKCENSAGYSCVKAGAKAIKITTTGGVNGKPAQNNIEVTIHTCEGCSFSCQFYPNKKTECWDSGCMGKCFISCTNSCSTSCFGGCINNEPNETSDYKTGKGRGCDDACTINCVGTCEGVCEGFCVKTCFHSCMQKCSDNCSYTCHTDCGSGCAQGCDKDCKGLCALGCDDSCKNNSMFTSCTGCSMEGGCNAECTFGCNVMCTGDGCKSMCGITSNNNACNANCRMNCSGTSCTSKCSDACSSTCTSCVNTCDMQCGACSGMCSVGCTQECNITCTNNCENNCSTNCLQSCSSLCGGCSNLCMSCVGMCIGVCSVSCQETCTNCANNCSWYCDLTCHQACYSNCNNMCKETCSNSCISFLTSNTNTTAGPERDPTSIGYIYPHPKNRWEERESFKLTNGVLPYIPPKPEPTLIFITLDEIYNLKIICPEELIWVVKQTSITGGVFTIDLDTGEIFINEDMLDGLVEVNQPNLGNSDSVYIIIFEKNDNIPFTEKDISSKLPFGFERYPLIRDRQGRGIVCVERDLFLYPPEDEEGN